jgi:hypothetical protein
LFQLKIRFWALESASGSQTLHFSAHFYENRFGGNRLNQREHRIYRVITVGEIYHFLNT